MWGNDAVADGEDGENRFERSDGSDGVPEGRFRGVDRRVCADRCGDGLCFGDVAGRGGGGVGIDVGDVGGCQPGSLNGVGHRASGSAAGGVGSDKMVTVGGGTAAEQTRMDRRTACEGMRLGFEDHQRSGLAEDETVPVLVERTRRTGRVGIVRAQRAHRGEAGDGKRIDAAFDSAGDDHVGVTHRNHPVGLRDGFRS